MNFHYSRVWKPIKICNFDNLALPEWEHFQTWRFDFDPREPIDQTSSRGEA